MTAAPTIRLRASLTPTWLTCSARAGYEAMQEAGPPGPVDVATEFGNQVHAAVTGHEYAPAASILYDEHTPTERAMRWQVSDAVEAALAEIEAQEGQIAYREEALSARVSAGGLTVLVTATLDLVIEGVGPHSDIVDLFDLKTGRMDQRSSWSQMAICAFLAHQAGWAVRDAVILHVPRARTVPATPDQASSLMRMPAALLVENAWGIIRSVALAAESPVAVPGIHCGRCPNRNCMFHDQGETNVED